MIAHTPSLVGPNFPHFPVVSLEKDPTTYSLLLRPPWNEKFYNKTRAGCQTKATYLNISSFYLLRPKGVGELPLGFDDNLFRRLS